MSSLTTRPSKLGKKLTADETAFAGEILNRVFQILEFDSDLSERGQAHPDAMFSDGGRFLLCMKRSQFESLSTIIEKMGGFDD